MRSTQLRRSRELPGGPRERSGPVALEYDGPSREDSGRVTRDAGRSRRVAVDAAQLVSQAVDVVHAVMPAHGAVLGATLVARSKPRARPLVPPLDGGFLLACGLLPTCAQRRQRQIFGQAPAAKPDRTL